MELVYVHARESCPFTEVSALDRFAQYLQELHSPTMAYTFDRLVENKPVNNLHLTCIPPGSNPKRLDCGMLYRDGNVLKAVFT